MELILHGQRTATNGDVRLMPTPEQWDLVATLKGRHADKANDRLIADLSFPTFDFSYTLEVAAEPGGVKVGINLDKPLRQKLEGRAGFNLEFLPSIYMGKAYDGIAPGLFLGITRRKEHKHIAINRVSFQIAFHSRSVKFDMFDYYGLCIGDGRRHIRLNLRR